MFKRIDHVELVPRNAEETIDFYVSVLGFRLRSRKPASRSPVREFVYLELGDTVVEVISADNPKLRSEASWQVGYRAIALEVENMKETVEYLEGKGVAMAREPVDLSDSLRAEIRDPDGLIIELRQWK
jgi:glyoxylase I family protein